MNRTSPIKILGIIVIVLIAAIFALVLVCDAQQDAFYCQQFMQLLNNIISLFM